MFKKLGEKLGLTRENILGAKFESDSKDEAYYDRNLAIQLAAYLAYRDGFNVGVRDRDSDWPIIQIELPTGQITYHIPKDELLLLNERRFREPALPWDGHSLRVKQERIKQYLSQR